MISKVLECAHFNPRHTAKNLEADINRIREDFEIEKKLVHLCADNAKAQQNACKGMFSSEYVQYSQISIIQMRHRAR